MAKALASVAEKIQEQITCPICFNTFEDPKMLPCQHVFCQACLVGHTNQRTITCPKCRSGVQSDIRSLPTALLINELKELCQDLPQPEAPNSTEDTDSAPTASKKHQCNKVQYFCESCQKPVCKDCVAADGKHATHEYSHLFLAKAASSCRAYTHKKLTPAKLLQEQLSTAITEVSQTKHKVEQQKAVLADEINTSIDALVRVLQEQKQSLQHEMEGVVNCKIHAITAQEQELIAAQKELQGLIDQTESAATTEFLSEELQLANWQRLKRIAEVRKRVKCLNLAPVEISNVVVKFTTPEELRSHCIQKRSVYFLVDPTKCTVSGNQGGETGEKSTFTVHLLDSRGRPCTTSQKVTAELKPLRYSSKMDTSTVTAQVEATSRSQYEVSYHPQARGRHQLSVKVSNTHIAGSPFQVFIQHPPTKLDVPVEKISCPQDANGLLHTDGKLFVGIGSGTGILVLDYNFERTAAIGRGQLQGPSGLGVDQYSNLYVTTCKDHQLHKFTKDGTHVKCTGGKGMKPGNFDSPNGIAVSRDGRVYVCDTKNSRIQVLDSELNLLPEIGSKGTASGKFKQPSAIDFDSSGFMYVADSDNHRIQVLTREGRFLQSFGKSGKKPGQLGKPINLKVIGNYLYIVEKENNRISVFSMSGHFISMFGKGHLIRPEGIAVDEDGFVYVSSDRKNIVVF